MHIWCSNLWFGTDVSRLWPSLWCWRVSENCSDGAPGPRYARWHDTHGWNAFRVSGFECQFSSVVETCRQLLELFDMSGKTKSPSEAATLLFRCWLWMSLWSICGYHQRLNWYIFVKIIENREKYFYSIRDTIPPRELEDVEEVWRILKAHDKALDKHLARIIYVKTFDRISSQILKNLFLYPKNCTQFNRIYRNIQLIPKTEFRHPVYWNALFIPKKSVYFLMLTFDNFVF